MSKIVYALYDAHEQKLHQFSADVVVLAKDAVSTYIVERILPNAPMPEETVKDMLTALSSSKDVPELLVVLEHYDFLMALMPVNNL